MELIMPARRNLRITREQVELAQRLLAEGKTYREVAAGAGISKGSVCTIALGQQVFQRQESGEERIPDKLPTPFRRGIKIRCRGCGRLIHPPCLACSTPKNSVRYGGGEGDGDLSCRLPEESEQRRIDLQRHKRVMGEPNARRSTQFAGGQGSLD
jgi:hypothetical protein